MNPLNAVFEDYQAQYETALPLKAREALSYVQIKVHKAATFVEESSQVLSCVVSLVQFAVVVFSLFPSLDSSYLDGPKQFCKDVRNFTSFVKGSKSIDGFLNFKFKWQPIVLNILGLTLSILSGLSLVERFQFYNVTPIKTALAAIPIFGILPWGGLFPFSVVGVMGIISLFAIEKMGKLKAEEMHIKGDKLPFWSTSLDLSKVKDKQCKFQAEILNLEEEIAAYENLIEEGEEVKADLIQRFDQARHLVACQKALNELNNTMTKAKAILAKKEQKAEQWNLLEKNWSYIDPQELESFRQAKQAKWKKKLQKVENEKKATLLSITNSVVTLARQALVIISVATGYGILTLPFLVNIGLDAYIAGTSIITFFMKKSIKKIKIPSENLTSHIKFDGPVIL